MPLSSSNISLPFVCNVLRVIAQHAASVYNKWDVNDGSASICHSLCKLLEGCPCPAQRRTCSITELRLPNRDVSLWQIVSSRGQLLVKSNFIFWTSRKHLAGSALGLPLSSRSPPSLTFFLCVCLQSASVSKLRNMVSVVAGGWRALRGLGPPSEGFPLWLDGGSRIRSLSLWQVSSVNE